MEDWDTLRPHFTTRFSPEMSSSQRAALVEVCRQHKTEPVKAFMDRCRATQLTLDRHIPNDQKTGAIRGPTWTGITRASVRSSSAAYGKREDSRHTSTGPTPSPGRNTLPRQSALRHTFLTCEKLGFCRAFMCR